MKIIRLIRYERSKPPSDCIPCRLCGSHDHMDMVFDANGIRLGSRIGCYCPTAMDREREDPWETDWHENRQDAVDEWNKMQ